ncbi:MAG: butyrate kinase [Alistipes sp.]|nr:butyrate kinase [Alistipes sp.]
MHHASTNYRFGILAINTGSTSTKVAVYHDREVALELSFSHTAEQIAQFATVEDQLEWRRELILSSLAEHGVDIESLSTVIGRGGLLRPLESGVYEVSDAMCNELRNCTPQHASNFSAIISLAIARKIGVKAYIADPVVVDEFDEIAKLTGIKEIRRRSIFHALNQKATARLYASDIDRKYEELNLIVAHMGGGISVAAHRKGRVVDCNNALDGEGPIAPERAGSLPAGELVDLCFSGKYTHKEIRAMLSGKGGLISLTGNNSVKELVEKAEQGDAEIKLAIDLMVYGVIKNIGQMATVLRGDIDAIVLTGGIAHSKYITNAIIDSCRFLAPIAIYAGENELQSLAMNALRLLNGETEAKTY